MKYNYDLKNLSAGRHRGEVKGLSTRDYECKICGRILEDEELDYNDGLCNECCSKEGRKLRTNYIWNELNNIDLILENKRAKRV